MSESEYLSVTDADTLWLMYGTILVFFMQCGFAMLEVGYVQEKNTKKMCQWSSRSFTASYLDF